MANFTYTTVAGGLETKVVLNKEGESEEIVFMEKIQLNADKHFHSIVATGLEPNTTYEYTVGTGEDIFSGKFKTALEKGSKESFKFAYLADTKLQMKLMQRH